MCEVAHPSVVTGTVDEPLEVHVLGLVRASADLRGDLFIDLALVDHFVDGAHETVESVAAAHGEEDHRTSPAYSTRRNRVATSGHCVSVRCARRRMTRPLSDSVSTCDRQSIHAILAPNKPAPYAHDRHRHRAGGDDGVGSFAPDDAEGLRGGDHGADRRAAIGLAHDVHAHAEVAEPIGSDFGRRDVDPRRFGPHRVGAIQQRIEVVGVSASGAGYQ